MRYWVHINNQVSGPFEKEKLAGLPGFGPSSLIVPETPDGGAAAWKEASAFAEVLAALNPPPPPAQPERPSMDSLALTMRGSLIEEPAATEPEPVPQPAPAQPARPSEDSLALTMRGSLIEEPDVPAFSPEARPSPAGPIVFEPMIAVSEPPQDDAQRPAAVEAVPAAVSGPSLEPLRKKIDELGALLAAMGETQAQLLSELNSLERTQKDNILLDGK
jgi:hypothetical protein